MEVVFYFELKYNIYPEITSIMVDPITFVLRFIFDFWWLLLPLFLWQIYWEQYKYIRQSEYAKNINWDFVEIKFPANILKTPKAMEETFNALHSIHPDENKEMTWYNLNLKGFTPLNYAFLIIFHQKKIRFFIRFPKELNNFLKTRLYTFYPELQLEDTPDPLAVLPPQIPNSFFDVASYDIRLKKEDAYPIKTYSYIDIPSPNEPLDIFANFSEASSEIENNEWLIIQLLIVPTTANNKKIGNEWVKRAKEIKNKLIGIEEKESNPLIEEIVEFIKNLLLSPWQEISWKQKENQKKQEFSLQRLTPGEKNVLEKIENKMSKLGYWCNIRVAYIAPQDIIEQRKKIIETLIKSLFKNFESEDSNGFNVTELTYQKRLTTKLNLISFITKSLEYNDIIKYRKITLPLFMKKKLKSLKLDEGFILTSDELASILHPPLASVEATGFKKIQTKHIPPPTF